MDSELSEHRIAAIVDGVHAPDRTGARWRAAAGRPARPMRSPRALSLAIVVAVALLIVAMIPLLIPASQHQTLPPASSAPSPSH